MGLSVCYMVKECWILNSAFLYLQVCLLRMDREGRAIAYQLSFKRVWFSKLISSESDTWHWIFIEWLSAFGIIVIINKYIITWFNPDFLFNIYQEPYICKENFKIIHTMITTGLTGKNCQALKYVG